MRDLQRLSRSLRAASGRHRRFSAFPLASCRDETFELLEVVDGPFAANDTEPIRNHCVRRAGDRVRREVLVSGDERHVAVTTELATGLDLVLFADGYGGQVVRAGENRQGRKHLT